MDTIKLTIAANITYSGNTFNTKLNVEYKHTGKIWYCKKKGKDYYTSTDSPNIVIDWNSKGYKVFETKGYYFMDRLSIPTINANGKSDVWYINNCGDDYRINKVSKYGRKIHAELSKIEKPF